MFTDGSKDIEKTQVGCAYAIPEYQLTRFFKLNGRVSIFSAELTAIIEALKWIRDNQPDKVVILTDSLSSIWALQSGKSNSRPDLIIKISSLIDEVLRNKTILYLDWCPSHCNIIGNDMADEAAKLGSSKGSVLNLKIGKSEVYGLIKGAVKITGLVNGKNMHMVFVVNSAMNSQQRSYNIVMTCN